MTTELERTEEAAQQAQMNAVLSEQKAGDALGERDRVHEQLAETQRELAGFPARVRAVDSDNDKALGRLASERAALEVKRDALVARAERAEKAHQEVVEALAAARAKLQAAEDAQRRAKRAQAEKSLEEMINHLIEGLREPARPHLATLGYSDPDFNSHLPDFESYLLSYLEGMRERRVDEENARRIAEMPLAQRAEVSYEAREELRRLKEQEEAEEDERWRAMGKIEREQWWQQVLKKKGLQPAARELPDGSRVDENGVRIISRGHPDMSGRIEAEKAMSEDPNVGLGGERYDG